MQLKGPGKTGTFYCAGLFAGGIVIIVCPLTQVKNHNPA
jgi:hypothetical protein